jgi:hypothetical protein
MDALVGRVRLLRRMHGPGSSVPSTRERTSTVPWPCARYAAALSACAGASLTVGIPQAPRFASRVSIKTRISV